MFNSIYQTSTDPPPSTLFPEGLFKRQMSHRFPAPSPAVTRHHSREEVTSLTCGPEARSACLGPRWASFTSLYVVLCSGGHWLPFRSLNVTWSFLPQSFHTTLSSCGGVTLTPSSPSSALCHFLRPSVSTVLILPSAHGVCVH